MIFKDIVEYCVKRGNPFNSFEEASKAYDKHIERVIARTSGDPLRKFTLEYMEKVSQYFRKNKKRRFYTPDVYRFSEVRAFLKSKGLWGWQVFDCCGTDHTERIYCKDGVVIDLCDGYGYIEVRGLKPCDFWCLEQAYLRQRGY